MPSKCNLVLRRDQVQLPLLQIHNQGLTFSLFKCENLIITYSLVEILVRILLFVVQCHEESLLSLELPAVNYNSAVLISYFLRFVGLCNSCNLDSSEGMLFSTLTFSFQFHLSQSIFPTLEKWLEGGGGEVVLVVFHQCDKPGKNCRFWFILSLTYIVYISCRPMHEITFSTEDKPKLLSQVLHISL